MPAGPDSIRIQETFQCLFFRTPDFAIPYSHLSKPSKEVRSSRVDRREQNCSLFSGTDQDDINISIFLLSCLKIQN